MKICVTGGAGFIGSHLVDKFLELGHSLVVIDNLSSGKSENINPLAKFINIDINDDRIDRIFKEEQFDIVFHQAAQMNVRFSVENPKNDAINNIIGSINIFEAAKNHNVKKIVFASSGGTVYGEQFEHPARESHPTNPCSPYGIAKQANEKYLHYYADNYPLETVILRYGNVYGPRQNPHGEAGVIAIFIGKMLAGEQPIINGDGGITRDYIYIDDVVTANQIALDDGVSGTYNVGTGIEIDVNYIFQKIKESIGSDCTEIHGPAKIGEQRRSVISPELLREKFGWTPKMEFVAGLQKTVDHYRSTI